MSRDLASRVDRLVKVIGGNDYDSYTFSDVWATLDREDPATRHLPRGLRTLRNYVTLCCAETILTDPERLTDPSQGGCDPARLAAAQAKADALRVELGMAPDAPVEIETLARWLDVPAELAERLARRRRDLARLRPRPAEPADVEPS